MYCVYVPTNHLYIGDIFLVSSSDVIRPNMSVREGIGMPIWVLFLFFPSYLYIQISMLWITLILNIILLQKLLSLWARQCLKYYRFWKLSQTSWTGSDPPEAEMTLHFVISCSRILVYASTRVGSDRLYSSPGWKAKSVCGQISPERDCLYGSLIFFRNVT